MKRGLVICFVLLLSVSFISAFSFSDLLPAHISGNIVDENCVSKCLEEKCGDFGTLRKKLCLDSDVRAKQCEEECDVGGDSDLINENSVSPNTGYTSPTINNNVPTPSSENIEEEKKEREADLTNEGEAQVPIITPGNDGEIFLTYSDNLLIDGDFSFQEWSEDDELFMWNLVSYGWCDRFVKEGFLEVSCQYGPALAKVFPRQRVDYDLIELVLNNTYDSRNSIWFEVKPKEEYVIKYDFADCLSKVGIIGRNKKEQIVDIKEDFVHECIKGWDSRQIKFKIPQDITNIAMFFEYDTVDYQEGHGLLDNVELLEVVNGCYDSDYKFYGKSEIHYQGYVKVMEKKIEDVCKGDYLIEGDCSNNKLTRKTKCVNGCYNGVCLEHEYKFKHPNSFITEGDIEAIKYLIKNDYWRNISYQEFKSHRFDDCMLVYDGNGIPYTECWFIDRVPQVPGPQEAEPWHSKAKEDANIMKTLAIAYLITGNTTYADKSIDFLNAWSNAPYAKGSDSSLRIFSSVFGMNLAADYMYDYDGWVEDDREAYKEWVRGLVNVYRDYPELNNHGTWQLLFLMSSAQILEDPELFDYTVREWKEHMYNIMDEDGVFVWEIHRGATGTWYHYFTHAPASVAAEIARHNGIDLYNYERNGRGLKKSVDFFTPYVLNESAWPYYQPAWNIWNVFYYENFYSLYKEPQYLEILNAKRGEHGLLTPDFWYPLPPATLLSSYSEICEDFDGDGLYTNISCGSLDCDDDDWSVRECSLPGEKSFFSNFWSRMTGKVVDLFS